jgi:hypothetical protein
VEILGLSAFLERVFPDAEGRISYHYVLLDFLCCYTGGKPRAGSDILELCFTPLPFLKNYGLSKLASEVILKAHSQLSNGNFLTPVSALSKSMVEF